MSPGEWIAAIGLLMTLLGLLAGGVWWAAAMRISVSQLVHSVEGMRDDIHEMRDNHSEHRERVRDSLADHEHRIKRLETHDAANKEHIDELLKHKP